MAAGMSAGISWYGFFIDTGDAGTTGSTWLLFPHDSGGGVGTWRTRSRIFHLQGPDPRVPVRRIDDAIDRVQRHAVGTIRESLAVVGRPSRSVVFGRNDVRLGLSRSVATGVTELR